MNACPYPTRPARRVLTLLLLSAVAVIGCGGNVVVDHGGDTSGNGGSGGSGPPSKDGTPTAACQETESGLTLCIQAFDTKTASLITQSCSGMNGKLISACPASASGGCCTISEGASVFEECAYSGISLAEFKKACGAERGTFSASP